MSANGRSRAQMSEDMKRHHRRAKARAAPSHDDSEHPPMTDEMQEHTRLLIELNEPEALIESLKRVCQRKVDSFAEGSIPPEEAKRWRTAASALTHALDTIMAPQAPRGASNGSDEPNPQPGDLPAEGQAGPAPEDSTRA